ncbi:MAG: hypothetical protein HY812_08440 [Planctomycetes bacterium]|nr:hypothetical protein [Planctomycetota bacterium]
MPAETNTAEARSAQEARPRIVAPAWWALGLAAASAAGFLAHGRLYHTWWLYFVLLYAGAAAMCLAAAAWYVRGRRAGSRSTEVLAAWVGVAVVVALLVSSPGLRSPWPRFLLLHLALLALALLCISLVALLVAALMRRTSIARWALRASGALFFWLVVVVFGGDAIEWHDDLALRQYCESLIPRLEVYRAEHGAYPDALADAGIDPEMPWPCVFRDVDYDGGQTISFFIEDPSVLFFIGGWSFESGEWHYWSD